MLRKTKDVYIQGFSGFMNKETVDSTKNKNKNKNAPRMAGQIRDRYRSTVLYLEPPLRQGTGLPILVLYFPYVA